MRRLDLSRWAPCSSAAWSNDVPQALDAPAAAQRLVVAGEETLFTRGDVARCRARAAAQAARGRGLNRPERERSAPRKLEQEQPLLRLEWEASAKQQAAKKRRQMQDAATPSPAVAPPPAEEEVEEVEEVEDGSPAAASPASAVVDLEGAGGGGDDDEVQFVSEAQSPEREAKRQQKWEQLKELVAAKGYDAAVLDGWVVRVERRRNGGTQGQLDTYFDAPGRKKLRSFNDVYEYLLQLHGVGVGPSSSASTAAGATPAEEWQTDHDLVGRKVRRFDPSFPGETFNGTIVGWDPTGFQDEPPEPLFHVRHDDGDEEDLEEHEARMPSRPSTTTPPPPLAVAAGSGRRPPPARAAAAAARRSGRAGRSRRAPTRRRRPPPCPPPPRPPPPRPSPSRATGGPRRWWRRAWRRRGARLEASLYVHLGTPRSRAATSGAPCRRCAAGATPLWSRRRAAASRCATSCPR